jgi:hypothetical protein
MYLKLLQYPSALETCSPLWTAWTLIILTSLATLSPSRSATQSARTTFRWSGKGSLHPVAGAACYEERRRKEFIKKVVRGAAVAARLDTPDFSFHPMVFDLKRSLGAVCISHCRRRVAHRLSENDRASSSHPPPVYPSCLPQYLGMERDAHSSTPPTAVP